MRRAMRNCDRIGRKGRESKVGGQDVIMSRHSLTGTVFFLSFRIITVWFPFLLRLRCFLEYRTSASNNPKIQFRPLSAYTNSVSFSQLFWVFFSDDEAGKDLKKQLKNLKRLPLLSAKVGLDRYSILLAPLKLTPSTQILQAAGGAASSGRSPDHRDAI